MWRCEEIQSYLHLGRGTDTAPRNSAAAPRKLKGLNQLRDGKKDMGCHVAMRSEAGIPASSCRLSLLSDLFRSRFRGVVAPLAGTQPLPSLPNTRTIMTGCEHTSD